MSTKKPYTRPTLTRLPPDDPRVLAFQLLGGHTPAVAQHAEQANDELGGLVVESTLADGSVIAGRVGEKTYEALRAHFAKERKS